MDKKLKIKDLVLIGVFTVIYFVVMFGVGMMGIIPILFLVYPIVLSIVAGPIIMLFMAKVQKPWALFILGMLPPIGMFFMGHTYIMPLHAFVIMIASEMIRRAGGYSSFKYNMMSYAIFSTWICGSLMQMIWTRKKYIELSIDDGQRVC